jgi:hypothetical protein
MRDYLFFFLRNIGDCFSSGWIGPTSLHRLSQVKTSKPDNKRKYASYKTRVASSGVFNQSRFKTTKGNAKKFPKHSPLSDNDSAYRKGCKGNLYCLRRYKKSKAASFILGLAAQMAIQQADI